MDFLTSMFDFFFNILKGASDLATWLTTSHSFLNGTFTINPLMFLTVGGLLTYLALAVTGWLISII